MTLNKRHTFSLKPDVPDSRDRLYSRRQALLPAKVDLREGCSPVENQGQMGSCTANALVGALEYLERKSPLLFTDLSRLFIYFNERAILHEEGVDSGARLRDGIKVLKNFGVCSENTWPYEESLLLERPHTEAYEEALLHRISKYERLSNHDDRRDALASGLPFVFGIQVYSSFETPSVAKSGVVPLPSPAEELLGGHALLAIGYDDAQKVFFFRNSWGAQWGNQGYGTIPYSYFQRGLSQDFWAIEK